MKTCSNCKQMKEECSFTKRKLSPDGLQCWCKNCVNIYMRGWHKIHPGYGNRIGANWIQKNPENYKKLRKKYNVRRQRNLNWMPLYPNPFDESEIVVGHHINNEYVVYLPEDLHQAYYYGSDTERHRENLGYIVDQIYGQYNTKAL